MAGRESLQRQPTATDHVLIDFVRSNHHILSAMDVHNSSCRSIPAKEVIMKRLNNLLIKGTDFAQLDNGPARPNNDDIPGMRSGKFRGSPIGSAPQEYGAASKK
jgi:hypothetical protein